MKGKEGAESLSKSAAKNKKRREAAKVKWQLLNKASSMFKMDGF